MSFQPVRPSLAVLLFGLGSIALAQTPPSAGDISIQNERRPAEAPAERRGFAIELPPPLRPMAGGTRVQVRDIVIQGNTLFDEATLKAVLNGRYTQPLDLAGLRGLTDLVAAYYSDRGYPFTRVYLPEQDLGSGNLRMVVVEGRYGAIRIEAARTTAAQPAFPTDIEPRILEFFSRIKPGDVIASSTLERSTLLLEDQPGIKITPIIQPGRDPGTGDLMVRYQRANPFAGEVGADNHGSRFTGSGRARMDLTWNSPFGFGDQIKLTGLRSQGDLALASLAYSGLINGNGWRWRASVSSTEYVLGKDYAHLQRSGLARTRSLGVSYPYLRSQAANLTISTSVSTRRFSDIDGINETREEKRSTSVPLTLQFDFRDRLLGGAINYGYATITRSNLTLSDTALANDQSSTGPRTNGFSTRHELDFSRLQALPGNLSLFMRYYQQTVHKKNLDAADGISIGGPTAVRAYPVGEGSGDTGRLAQIELRYGIGDLSPYVFIDYGRVKVNAVLYDTTPNTRDLAASGIGVRSTRKVPDTSFLNTTDLAIAWSAAGGAAQSDSAGRPPRVWLTTSFRF